MKTDAPRFILTDPEGWFEGLRTGEFPNERELPDGTTEYALQVVEAADLAQLLASWEKEGRPELRIDKDHTSYQKGQSTEAMGYIVDMMITGDRLKPRSRWTETGEKLITGGEYRWTSLVLDCQPEEGQHHLAGTSPHVRKRVRPVRIDSAGLTSTPNVPGLMPLSNRAPAGGVSQPGPAAHNQPNKRMNKELLALLGLPETADEAAVIAAVKAMKDAQSAADAEKKTTVEGDMEEYANCIPKGQEEFFRSNLYTNRASTLTVLKGLRSHVKEPAKGQERVFNRATAGQMTNPLKQEENKTATLTEAEERDNHLAELRLRYPNSRRSELPLLARREKPELWGN